jgi:hypothetical protein
VVTTVNELALDRLLAALRASLREAIEAKPAVARSRSEQRHIDEMFDALEEAVDQLIATMPRPATDYQRRTFGWTRQPW